MMVHAANWCNDFLTEYSNNGDAFVVVGSVDVFDGVVVADLGSEAVHHILLEQR